MKRGHYCLRFMSRHDGATATPPSDGLRGVVRQAALLRQLLAHHLAPLGADLMVRALAALSRGALTFTPQPAECVTYAHKISNDETRIDWAKPAGAVHNQIRGLAPFPGAFFTADFGKGPERIKVLRTHKADGDGRPGALLDQRGTVACGEGAIRLEQVQRAGRPPVPAEDFLRGARMPTGASLANAARL